MRADVAARVQFLTEAYLLHNQQGVFLLPRREDFVRSSSVHIEQLVEGKVSESGVGEAPDKLLEVCCDAILLQLLL